MSSKALEIVKNNMIKKVSKLFENNFYLDENDEEDNYSFNHLIQQYIIFSKITKKYERTYYFTLEMCFEQLYLCVWFKDNHIDQHGSKIHSNYYKHVNDFIEVLDGMVHKQECGMFECNCDYDFTYQNYNDSRQKYYLEYYKKINMDECKLDLDKLKNEKIIDIKMNGLFDLILNLNFDYCINCNKIDSCITEDLCDNCLLKIDENLKEYTEECPICYDDECLKYKTKTPCNHTFHKECLLECRSKRIKEHNNNHNQCPHCRTEIKSEFFFKL